MKIIENKIECYLGNLIRTSTPFVSRKCARIETINNVKIFDEFFIYLNTTNVAMMKHRGAKVMFLCSYENFFGKCVRKFSTVSGNRI